MRYKVIIRGTVIKQMYSQTEEKETKNITQTLAQIYKHKSRENYFDEFLQLLYPHKRHNQLYELLSSMRTAFIFAHQFL